jgi:hypothetical protein
MREQETSSAEPPDRDEDIEGNFNATFTIYLNELRLCSKDLHFSTNRKRTKED